MGLLEHRVAFPASGKQAPVVRVRGRQIAAHRVDHALRHLRARGTVQENRGTPVHPPRQCREAAADMVDLRFKRLHARILTPSLGELPSS